MFCFYCGQQIPDGSVTCPICQGNLANAGAQQPQQVQQPQQYAQQPQQYAQQAQYAQQQAQQQAQYAQQQAQYAQQQAQQQAQYAQQQAQYAQQQAQQQYAQQQAQYAQRAGQPYGMQPVYNAAAVTSVPKPKKKSKVGLWVGLGAGGAALATTGIIVANTAQPGILRATMGDEGYAKSVQTTAIADVYTDVTTYAGIATDLGNIYGAAYGKQRRSYNRDYESSYDIYDKYSYSSINLAEQLYPYIDSFDDAGRNDLTMTIGVTAEMGDELKRLLEENVYDQDMRKKIEDAVKNVNNLQLKVAKTSDSSGYGIQISALGDNSEFAGAVMRLSKSGELRISFPNMSDKVLTAQLPSYDELGFEDNGGEKGSKLDMQKVRDFCRKVTEAYFRGYKYAEINYSDESVAFGDSNTNCTVITVTMDNKALAESLNAVADAIEKDKYAEELLQYFGADSDNFYDYYSDSYTDFKGYAVSSIRKMADNLEDSSYKYELVTENYVNGANKSLGAKYRFKRDREELFRFEDLDNGSYIGINLLIQGSKLFSIEGTHSGNSGDVDITVDTSSFYYRGGKISLNLRYSDYGSFKAFDTDMIGGKFTVKLNNVDEMFGGMDRQIREIIEKAEITLEMSGQDNGYKLSVGAKVEDYGSASVYYTLVPSASVANVSGGGNTIDLENIDYTTTQELTQEILEYIQKKADSNTGAKIINDLFLGPVMTGYVSSSRVTSADSTASTLKDSMNTFITDMDARNASILRKPDIYEFRLDVNNGNVSVTTDYPNEIFSKKALEYDGGYGGSGWLDRLGRKIADEYNFRNATAWIYVKNGMCIGVAYYEGEGGWYIDHPQGSDFESGRYYWSGSQDGMTSGGDIIGTNPKLISY